MVLDAPEAGGVLAGFRLDLNLGRFLGATGLAGVRASSVEPTAVRRRSRRRDIPL
jgi:hypothetical protein